MKESDKVFYGNLCFVCHVSVNEVKLRKCASCKLVSYCGEDHQKTHWKRHRPFCKAARYLLALLSLQGVKTHREWFRFRTKLLASCEVLMKRKLTPGEMNMILFPNNCQICHSTADLMPCPTCLCVNYCSQNHKQLDLPFHATLCSSFGLCLDLDLYLEKNSFYPDYHFGENPLTLTDTMTAFIEANIKCGEENSVDLKLKRALVSELITCPMSVLHAARLMNYRFTGNVVLHVVGCSYLETGSLKSWELILHVHPHLEGLQVHFIGPEVQEIGRRQIDTCQSCRKKIQIKTFKGYYHEYLKTVPNSEPSLICTFNCGYHEFENTDSDTWKESLPLLVGNPKVPLIFTSFTEEEADMDGKRLLLVDNTLNLKVVRNEFRSLRPYRDLEKMGLYFSNELIGMVFEDSEVKE